MSEKEKDPEAIKQNISHKPIDYVKLNRLSEDFGKCFVQQQELTVKQAFWFHMSNPTIKSSVASPVKMEAPNELPKIRTTHDARTEGEWGFEHTKAVFNNEIIPFLKSLKDIFNVFDKDLLNEIMEVQTVFDQMDAAVQQSSIDKQCLEIAKKELLSENDRLLQQIMSQDVFKDQFDSIKKTCVRTKEQSDSLIDKLNLKSAKNGDLKAQNQDKVFVITSLKNDLQKVKGKEIIDIDAQIPSTNTIVPGMFKLDLEPLAPRLLQNREAHIDYLKYTQEQADILREIINMPNGDKLNAKKVAVTPKNNVKKVRFAEPLTSSSNIKQVRFLRTKDEAPEAIIKCIKNIQDCLNATVHNVQTYNETEFVNQTLREFYENVVISHQTSVVRTPQQNDVVERRN
ncbi:retrovirus-related pol polyprotein from transposon TNT 1-94 [Tanacetum coccineum]